jgi:hypothetical protein
MSHYTELKPKFLTKSENELVAALQKLFGENSVEVHDTAVKIGGYDSQANKKAHIVVRKEAVKKTCGTWGYNDIGYERDGDGMYKLWADPTDFPVAKQDLIAQDYAERVAAKKLKAQGYTLKREVLKDGVVKLVATKYS